MVIQCGLNGLRQGDGDFKFNQRNQDLCSRHWGSDMTIPVFSAWDCLPHVAEDDQWATGCPVSILNEASGLGWTERQTYSKWKTGRLWCCFLGWDIGYPRSMDWLGICFFIQRGEEVTWNFDNLVGIYLAVWRRLLYCIMSPEGRACPGHRVAVGSRIHGVLGRSSEQPVLWKVLGASHIGKKSAQSETGHPHPSCSQQIKVCFTVPTLGCSEPTRWAISHLTVATGISWQRAQVPVIHEQELTHRTHLYTVDETLEWLNCSNFFFFLMYLF